MVLALEDRIHEYTRVLDEHPVHDPAVAAHDTRDAVVVEDLARGITLELVDGLDSLDGVSEPGWPNLQDLRCVSTTCQDLSASVAGILGQPQGDGLGMFPGCRFP